MGLNNRQLLIFVLSLAELPEWMDADIFFHYHNYCSGRIFVQCEYFSRANPTSTPITDKPRIMVSWELRGSFPIFKLSRSLFLVGGG